MAQGLKDRVKHLLGIDPVCLGNVSGSTVAAIALEVEAEAQARMDRIAPEGLDDVIAFLELRRFAATSLAERRPQHGEVATDRDRQIAVLIADFRAGLHLGCAARLAELAGVDAAPGGLAIGGGQAA